jgi:hypothetical protein
MGLALTLQIFRVHTEIRLLSVCLLLCGSVIATYAQAVPAFRYRTGSALTVGVTNTQFPFYADNAVGFDFALFYQRSALVGIQVKAGSYPYSARFSQTPITIGYRIGRSPTGRESSLGSGWNPFAYIGGGISHSRDSDTSGHLVSAVWENCIQMSAGVDHQYRNFSWRAAEVSWTETYAANHNLRAVGVSTGLVYHFRY